MKQPSGKNLDGCRRMLVGDSYFSAKLPEIIKLSGRVEEEHIDDLGEAIPLHACLHISISCSQLCPFSLLFLGFLNRKSVPSQTCRISSKSKWNESFGDSGTRSSEASKF